MNIYQAERTLMISRTLHSGAIQMYKVVDDPIKLSEVCKFFHFLNYISFSRSF